MIPKDGWGIINYYKVRDTKSPFYVDELVDFTHSGLYSGEFSTLLDRFGTAPRQLLANQMTEKEFLVICQRLKEQILFDLAQRENYSFQMLTGYRVASRLEYIIQLINNGKSVEEACKPYALNIVKKYADETLLAEREEAIKDSFAQYALTQLAAWIRKEKESRESYPVNQDVLKALQSLGALGEQYTDQVILLYLELIKYSSIPLHHQQSGWRKQDYSIATFVKSSSKSTQMALPAALFADADAAKLLLERGQLSEVLSFFCDQDYAYHVLITSKKVDLSQLERLIGLKDFFTVVQKIKGPSGETGLKILLQSGLNYAGFITPMLAELSDYLPEANLVLYEALARGDSNTASMLLQTNSETATQIQRSTAHSEVKMGRYDQYAATGKRSGDSMQYTAAGVSQQSMFAKQELTDKRFATYQQNRISFSVEGFIAYLKKKYEVTPAEQRNSLYFVTHSSELAGKLVELQLVADDKIFIRTMRDELKLPQEMLDLESSTASLHEARIQQLEIENTSLKERVTNMEQQILTLFAALQLKNDSSATSYKLEI